MDVLSIIKEEHHAVGALIDEANGCEPGDERLIELAKEIQSKLALHLAIEERLFYAKLRDGAEEQEEQVDVFEAYTEHTVAKSLMEMLQSGRKSDERFKAELQVLGESVKHHVQEEESKVFGIARELLDAEQREAIGAAWEKAKQRGLKQATANGAARKETAKKSPRKSSSVSKNGAVKKKKTARR